MTNVYLTLYLAAFRSIRSHRLYCLGYVLSTGRRLTVPYRGACGLSVVASPVRLLGNSTMWAVFDYLGSSSERGRFCLTRFVSITRGRFSDEVSRGRRIHWDENENRSGHRDNTYSPVKVGAARMRCEQEQQVFAVAVTVAVAAALDIVFRSVHGSCEVLSVRPMERCRAS